MSEDGTVLIRKRIKSHIGILFDPTRNGDRAKLQRIRRRKYIAKHRKEELELENSRKYSKPRKEKLRKRNSSGKIERPRMAPKLRADLDT